MKNIAVLLNGSIQNDSRVIKEITTMSSIAKVDLFYINGKKTDSQIFSNNVRLFSIEHKETLRTKIIRNSCFQNEFLFFVEEVVKQKINYNFVWANDLPTLKPALKIKKKIGAKVIYDSHEIFIGTLNQFFPDKAKWYKKILHKTLLFLMKICGSSAEKRMVKKIDTFITTGDSFSNYFKSKFGLDDIKIVINCPRKTEILKAFDFRKEYNLPADSFIVIFQGCLNKGRALEEMIEAFKYVNDNVILIVLGNGMLKPLLIELTQKNKLTDKIFFKDAVPSKDLLTYTKGADLGINLQSSINISKHLASANKLFEYMHAGIPIVASEVPENELVLNEYKTGVLVKNIPQQIAEAINKMSQSDLSKYKANCSKATQEYNWENQEKVILEIINTN